MADTRQKLFLGESAQSSSGSRNYFVPYLHEFRLYRFSIFFINTNVTGLDFVLLSFQLA